VQDGRQLGEVRGQDIAVDVMLGDARGPDGPSLDIFVGARRHPALLVQRVLDAVGDEQGRAVAVILGRDAVRGVFQLAGYLLGQGLLVLFGHLLTVREPPR
jgi:hypothetical protein